MCICLYICVYNMAETLTRVTLYIGARQKAQLEKLSEQTDRPVAAMIRRAIDAYLDQEEAVLKKRK
jgi:predicted DNA-binding protein